MTKREQREIAAYMAAVSLNEFLKVYPFTENAPAQLALAVDTLDWLREEAGMQPEIADEYHTDIR